MKKIECFSLLILMFILIGCDNQDDELTPTDVDPISSVTSSEFQIPEDLIGTWKLVYDQQNGSSDGTAGEITLTVLSSGTFMTENVANIYNHYTEYGGSTGVDINSDYKLSKYEIEILSNNRIKISGKPYYWSVYSATNDNDNLITYLDFTDNYNLTVDQFMVDDPSNGWDSNHSDIIECVVFPNNSFVKQ